MLSYYFFVYYRGQSVLKLNWNPSIAVKKKNRCHKNRLGLANGLGIFVCFPQSDFSWASRNSWISVFILFLSLKTIRLHFQSWHVTLVATRTSCWGTSELVLPPGFPVIRACRVIAG